MEALQQAVRDEEDFQESKQLKDNHASGSNSSRTRKCHEHTAVKTMKKPKYTTKEKRVYEAKKKEERTEKGSRDPGRK